jgi:diphthine-ammonia ligase
LTIAGQIPLIPSTLLLPPQNATHASPYPVQAALALQHVRRIVAALKSGSSTGGGWDGWTEGVVGWWAKGSTDGHEAVDVLKAVWEEHADRVSNCCSQCTQY